MTNEQVISIKDYEIHHIRNVNNPATGGVTMLIKKTSTHKQHEVRISVCDVEDNYDKSFGIYRALNNPDSISFVVDQTQRGLPKDNARNILHKAFETKSVYERIRYSLYDFKADKNSTGKQLGKAQLKIKELEDYVLHLEAALMNAENWIRGAEYVLNNHFKQNGERSI
jgi:hypothetical protein